MVNNGRIFRVFPIESIERLADKLANHYQRLCSGFYHDGFLYLNDSMSEDGPKKFAVLKADRLPEAGRLELDQVKSLSLAGCTQQKAQELIEEARAAEPFARVVVQMDGPGHSCPLCAL